MATIKFKDPNTGNFITIQSISGKSAYQSAREAGFTGSEAEFMQSLANAASVDKKLDKSGGSMDNTDLVTNMNADLLDGKHGSEYAGSQHQHGSITTDGRVGTTSDLLLGTGAGGQIVTKTPSEVATLVGVSNPNILHNWDFTNPINQRGVSGAISTTGYFLDRWYKTSYHSITLNPHSINVAQYAALEQRIEGVSLAGEECTFSAEIGGVIHSVAMVFPATTGEVSAAFGNLFFVTLKTGDSYMTIQFMPNETLSEITRFKLERGPISTLHLDPPMDWAAELSKCQYFCYVLNGLNTFAQANLGMGWRHSADAAVFRMFLPTQMRIKPSVSVYSGNVLISNTNINAGIGSGLHTVNGADAYFAVAGLNPGTVGESVAVITNDSAKILFSADL